MKHMKKILVTLMALGLCGTLAACSSPAADTKDDSAETKTAEEEKPETEAEPEEDDTSNAPNIGIIASTMDRAAVSEFATAVQTALSEQYSDQIGEVLVMNAQGSNAYLFDLLRNCIARWENKNNVILIVNDDENGFSDDVLFDFLENAEGYDYIVGLDHTIDGAPGNVFVYDISDVAGCASMIMENVLK